MDRAVVTGMVEDYWRAFIPVAQSGNVQAVVEVRQRFEERLEQTASLLPPIEAAAFQQAVEAERERLLDEYEADPASMKTRLGLELGVDGPSARSAPQRPVRASSGMGDLVVRTAVRATIWESIWSLFRAFR